MTDMLDMVEVRLISDGTRLRPANEGQVEALMESISDVGILNPVTLYRRKVLDGIAVDGFGIVAGLHRVTAARRLGMETIPAHIVTLGDLERQIAECDENLCGPKLTPAERVLFTRRRKEAYEALHPETRRGVAGALASNKKQGKGATDMLSVASYAEDQAIKSGQDVRTVFRDSARGEKIDESVLAEIQGTHLDSGAYMDKLKGLSKVEQRAMVKRDLDKHQKDAERQEAQERDDKEAREGAEWIAEEFGVAAIPALVALLETVPLKKLCAELRRHL
jgi:ParB family chromosome partitioning protein